MTALDDLLKLADDVAKVQRVEVYERHCGNPGCQCQSMTDCDDDLGDYCRAKDVEALEERATDLARALKAVCEALEEVAECGHVSARVMTDAVRAAIERRLTARKDEP